MSTENVMNMEKQSRKQNLENYLRFINYRADRVSAKWTKPLKENGEVVVAGRITDRLFGITKGDKLLIYEYVDGRNDEYVCAAEIIEQFEVKTRTEALAEINKKYPDAPKVILGTEDAENRSYTVLRLKNKDIEATVEARRRARAKVKDEDLEEHERRMNEFLLKAERRIMEISKEKEELQ